MEHLVGTSLALGVGAVSTIVGFDRARAFYPTVMIVIATYYDLFAVMGGSAAALRWEMLISLLFITLAVIGFKRNLWLVAAALAGHGLFDLVHGHLIVNEGVPNWWPGFCMAYDLTAAAYLATRLALASSPPNSHFEAALRQASILCGRGEMDRAFHQMKRAHILGQRSTALHLRAHFRMLVWAIAQRDGTEAIGQILRLLAAAIVTPLGLVPIGNNGGSSTALLRTATIPDEIAVAITTRRRRSFKAWMSALLLIGTAFGASSCGGPPAGIRTLELDGRSVAYRVLGQGKPVIVLLSGLGDGMESFEDVAPKLAKGATVILYDRAGYGGSAAAEGPTDAADVERELASVLAASKVKGPYVLAGHSLGGLYAEYYAARHPEQIAGLILEESRTADFGRRCEAAKIDGCMASAAALQFAPNGAQREFAGLKAAEDQVLGTQTFAGKPVLVLTRPFGVPPTRWEALWTQTQRDLAARYPGARHLTAPDGGHYIHDDEQAWYLNSVWAFLSGLR